MICERCHERDATEHLSEITETSIRVGELCRACYIVERGPVSIEEVHPWMTIEQYQAIDFSPLVIEWFERTRVHGQRLPDDVQAFMERHRTPPPVE